MPRIEIAAFYKFARLPQYESLRAPLQSLCESHGVRGTLLLAREGINGTLAGEPASLHAVMDGIRAATGLEEIETKTSFADAMPFLRTKVRTKTEIVTIGDPTVDPLEGVGTYVEPEDWNALISDPETLVIDTRNGFEVAVGTFRGAVDPGTRSFSEFPAYVRENLDPEKHKKVAMFCTGGIRCEKATALMLREGFEQVYHLKGGILKYLERIAPEDSLWSGGCFVFDERVAVGHGLGVEPVQLCHGCRRPLTPEDKTLPGYEEGVSCAHCAPTLTEAQKASSRERMHQIRLAEARGVSHLGPKAE
ncbi:rhodanese-related sulfurtransferase [Azospirillum sp. SYSU D00513]|uniref:oxygen-dependent tRNA uridine(34) hydroxylase TrhO n=1 Tax=Azospirillum sp. SYSU D00513 TaxID=2812561 RepID=UPI001A971952|nr:rhodanese-related sulfurtransferase [Azospirillum sp. SYSU D00513]